MRLHDMGLGAASGPGGSGIFSLKVWASSFRLGSTIGIREERAAQWACARTRAASYPPIQCGGGDFPFIAGGGCGDWRLI